MRHSGWQYGISSVRAPGKRPMSGTQFGSFSAAPKWLDPARMRCATFARTHGREAESFLMSGHTHLDRECNTAQARAMLDGAAQHRKWMLEKARECVAQGRKIDRAEVNRMNRRLQRGIRSLSARLRRPCTPKHAPYEPLDLPAIKAAIRRSQAARVARG